MDEEDKGKVTLATDIPSNVTLPPRETTEEVLARVGTIHEFLKELGLGAQESNPFLTMFDNQVNGVKIPELDINTSGVNNALLRLANARRRNIEGLNDAATKTVKDTRRDAIANGLGSGLLELFTGGGAGRRTDELLDRFTTARNEATKVNATSGALADQAEAEVDLQREQFNIENEYKRHEALKEQMKNKQSMALARLNIALKQSDLLLDLYKAEQDQGNNERALQFKAELAHLQDVTDRLRIEATNYATVMQNVTATQQLLVQLANSKTGNSTGGRSTDVLELVEDMSGASKFLSDFNTETGDPALYQEALSSLSQTEFKLINNLENATKEEFQQIALHLQDRMMKGAQFSPEVMKKVLDVGRSKFSVDLANPNSDPVDIGQKGPGNDTTSHLKFSPDSRLVKPPIINPGVGPVRATNPDQHLVTGEKKPASSFIDIEETFNKFPEAVRVMIHRNGYDPYKFSYQDIEDLNPLEPYDPDKHVILTGGAGFGAHYVRQSFFNRKK